MLSITTTLKTNKGTDRLNTPYIATAHCPTIINRGPEFEVPVRAAYIGMKKTLSVEVAGFRSITEHISAVPSLIERLIEGVARGGRIPHYVFIARDAGTIYPVYTIDDEVLAPTPNGPLFQHVELAKVRERLTDYLHDIKVLGVNGRTDKLHVRGVHRRTLQLIRPRFYLKKRVAGEDDFWAPVFASVDSPTVYAYAANERREARLGINDSVFQLRKLVAKVLMEDGRLSDPYDLRPDRLFAGTWEAMQEKLSVIDQAIVVNDVVLPMYKNGSGEVIAVERRPNEERYNLFIGADVEDVRRRVMQDFARRGIGI